LRARTLAALSCVDYVVVVPFPGAEEAIAAVRPHVFCRGKEDQERRHEDNSFQQALTAAGKIGAQIRYVGAVTYSSTRLLNNHFDHLPAGVKNFCAALARDCTSQDFIEAVEGFSALKTLVIGDTIFDRYSYVKVQGLTSKNRIISGRFLREETQCGGALAVFRHVKQFAPNARFLSLVGAEPWVESLLREHVAPDEDKTIRAPGFTTVIKQRFVEPLAEGKELGKLFSVNYIDAEPPAAETLARLAETIRREIAWAERRGRPAPSRLEVGAMIEAPSLLWHLDALLPMTDFVSVGTNDLMQYLFAADRGNSRVSDRYDPLSPPALRALKTIQSACAETGTPVSVCGEIAGRPLEAFALVGLGFERLSMPPSGIGAVKQMVLSCDREATRRGIESLLRSPSGSVRSEIESLARKLFVAV